MSRKYELKESPRRRDKVRKGYRATGRGYMDDKPASSKTPWRPAG